MRQDFSRNGIAIALAWPETLCRQAGSWYDKPMKWLGINKNNYYKVGHAAVVLIKKEDGECHYFDFGRYHSPHGHGRVRNAFADHDLEIKTKAVIEGNVIVNYSELLSEIHSNSSCHGDGNLHASWCEINFENAYDKAISLQQQSPLRYGPFIPSGTNCSRFVNTIILSGNPSWFYKLSLAFPTTVSPTPAGNVKALNNQIILGEQQLSKLNLL